MLFLALFSCFPQENSIYITRVFIYRILLYRKFRVCDWACSPMVGRSSGTLPTRAQIPVLAPFTGFSKIYRRYALSGKRRSHRRRGTNGDFGNLQICHAQSFEGAHRSRVCVCVFIGVSVRACCERLRCTVRF
jgi:hypothetical protein